MIEGVKQKLITIHHFSGTCTFLAMILVEEQEKDKATDQESHKYSAGYRWSQNWLGWPIQLQLPFAALHY